MNEITKSQPQTIQKRTARTSREEVARILAPMFAAFAYAKAPPATVAVYVELLQDIPSEKLANAVRICMEECEFLPTVAHIRKVYQENHAPGARNDLSLKEIAAREFNFSGKLYRESDEERRERLKRADQRERRYGDKRPGGAKW